MQFYLNVWIKEAKCFNKKLTNEYPNNTTSDRSVMKLSDKIIAKYLAPYRFMNKNILNL